VGRVKVSARRITYTTILITFAYAFLFLDNPQVEFKKG
jgi:hypothetical protein